MSRIYLHVSLLILIAISMEAVAAERWVNYTAANSGLVSDSVTGIAIDAAGNRWFATISSGVSLLHRGGIWTTYNTLNSGLASDSLDGIAIDQDGGKWFATDVDGVSVLRAGDTWDTYNALNSALPGNLLGTIEADHAGNIWLTTGYMVGGGGTRYCGITVIHPDSTQTTYNTANSGLATNRVNCIAIDAAGDAWFGTEYSGVSVLRYDGTWETYNGDNSGIGGENVECIGIDAVGNKWFGCYRWGGLGYIGCGVSVLHADGSWTTYNTSNSGLADDSVYDITADAHGNKWFGTSSRGVSVLQGDGSWTTYTRDNSGLAGFYVSHIAIDPMGNKWFKSGDGWGGCGVSVLCEMPTISVSVNQSLYHAGERMIVEASLRNPATPIAVDIYLGVGLPDGTFLSWPSFGAGLTPAYDDFTIPDSFSCGPSVVLEMNLPELSTGDYFWFAAMTEPEYMSQTVGDISIAPWSFE